MGKKILVVDDDLGTCALLKATFEKMGHTVFTVLSGEEALERIEEIKPDTVLLDFILGGMDGFDVCSRIKAAFPATRIVVFTANIEEVDAKKARESGADEFVVKTGDLSGIIKEVK